MSVQCEQISRGNPMHTHACLASDDHDIPTLEISADALASQPTIVSRNLPRVPGRRESSPIDQRATGSAWILEPAWGW